jgi:putative membrane-bound dehydrogenase-like protein
MPRFLIALLAVFAVAHSTLAQLPPDKALASLQAADGLQVELFAAEPMLVNPTSIDVDHLGRVWVCEAVNYRRIGFKRPILREEGDRIVILTDKDGDGKADESTVFYQGKELIAPLGICIIATPASLERKRGESSYSYRVLVCQSPDILEFWDKDGDGKADGPPKKFLTGFRGFDHDHCVHGINIGPDGKLYFTVGDSGVDGLQSADGKGPKFKSNSTDCRAGTVWRCDMDGNNVELIAHNFRNNYECCVNSFGEIWLSDNDDDGNQQTRICFVMPGGNYGYHPRGPGQSHWHEEQPGIVHKALRTGFGSPTGICFYEGTLLPKKYYGQLLHTDAGPRELRCFHIKPKGAGYELEKENLVTSTDNWFRLADVCVAPEGSVFIADWYDPGVGGHGMGDWKMGRIYRVTPKGHKGYKVAEVKLNTSEGFRSALTSPCMATRHMATATLKDMVSEITAAWKRSDKKPDEKARDAWKQLERFADALRGEDEPPSVKARWYWATCVNNPIGTNPTPLFRPHDAADLGGAGTDRKRPLVATALRIDRDNGNEFIFDPSDLMWSEHNGVRKDHALAKAKDKDLKETVSGFAPTPETRRELLITLRKLDPNVATRIFYVLAHQYDGQDHFYRAALNIACGTDPKRREAILADFDKHFPEWNDKVADLVWELRPASVLSRLGKLLDDPKLTAMQKGRIVDIIAVYDEANAGKTMIELLTRDVTTEIKTRAVENLRLYLPTKWNSLAKSDELNKAVAELVRVPSTMVLGLKLIAAAKIDAVESVAVVAKLKGFSEAVRVEAIKTLGALRSKESVEVLTDLLDEKALAAHVVAALAAQISETGKAKSNDPALEALQEIVLGKKPPELKNLALQGLAGSRTGTIWLLNQHEKGELPKELVAEAGRLLRNSPFQGQRNRALLLFPAPGKLDPKKLPSPAVLAKRAGNATRGEAVFKASFKSESQCQRCHMVRGVGGNIGPDLSMIGKKASKENLFESILLPSKAIADQYLQWKVNTLDEKSVTGLLVAENEREITLRDANGKDHTFAVKDLDGPKQKSLVSIMPDNLVAALTEDELIDLVEYMLTLKTPSVTPDYWYVMGPFIRAGDQPLGREFGPEKSAFDPKATFPEWNGPSSGPKAKDLGWRTIRPDAKGYVDLMAFHGEAGNNSVSYLYRAIESPIEQDAEILIGSDDGCIVSVNGKEVLRENVTRAAAPEQNKATVKLKKGKNEVLIKIANGNNPHGLYFAITSAEELKLVK